MENETSVSTHLWADRSGRRWRIRMEWGVVGGRAEPSKICVTAPVRGGEPLAPLTAAAIRAIPFPRLIQKARETHARLSREQVAHIRRLGRPGAEIALRHAEEFEGGRVVTPEHLRRVAVVYLAAKMKGVPVTRAVAAEIGCAISTAGKRIMMARRAGLLDVERGG